MAATGQRAARVWARYLERRIGAVLDSVPGHADPRSRCVPSAFSDGGDAPSWIRIPIWLDASWAHRRADAPPGGAVAHVVWGLYALFLSLRVKDDLLDGQRPDLRQLFVADRFLLESVAAFRRVPGLDDRFWRLLLDAVRETMDAAAEVGRLERRPGAFTSMQLALHARVSAFARVGAVAVCRLRGHEEDEGWVARLQERVAIGNQIVDDLRDLGDDLRRGRYTWVANTLLALRRGEVVSPDERCRRIGEGMLSPARGARVVGELARLAREAVADLPSGAPRPLRDYVRTLAAIPAELERTLHEARVRYVFRDALAEEP